MASSPFLAANSGGIGSASINAEGSGELADDEEFAAEEHAHRRAGPIFDPYFDEPYLLQLQTLGVCCISSGISTNT